MKKLLSIMFIIILITVGITIVFYSFLEKPVFNSTNTLKLYFDGVKDEEYKHIFTKDQIYISAEYLMDNDLLDYYWDIDYNKISIFNNYNYDKINYNENKAFYNKQPYEIEDVLLIRDNELYFNSYFLKERYIERIYIDTLNLKIIIEKDIREYKTVKDTKIRDNSSVFSKNLKEIDKGEKIFIYNNEKRGWLLARTNDNIIGFVKATDIIPISKVQFNNYPKSSEKKDIKLAWDLISSHIYDFEPFYIPDSINIIAPTWFELFCEDDLFIDLSNTEYIQYVKNSGKEIWAVFNNGFDPKLTNEMLNNGLKRSNIVDKIIDITVDKKFDGINIDFENIYVEDKDVFSAFIKELYCKAKANNIIMSVDVTILSNSENWSLCFDRNVIADYADYIILMAYDENVSGKAGSVSSLPWVEYGVSNLLEYAPSKKVVLGLPFYTRLWEEYEEKSVEKVKSTALKIESAEKVIDELEIELKYIEEYGQNYGEKEINGITYKIWHEDKMSLIKRLHIAKNYNLSGIAVWTLNYGTEEMWKALK